MKSVIKNASLVVASIALIFGSMTMMQKTKAAGNLLTGKCGGVFSTRTAADGVLTDGQNAGISASFIMDFDSNTTTVASTRQTFIIGAADIWTQDMKINKSITVEQDPDGMVGAYQVTVKFSDVPNVDNPNPVLRFIPVNSGNTFLLQGKTFGATGVCQKI